MASEMFRGEEDIDKSTIRIKAHAVEQFYKRSHENQPLPAEEFKDVREQLRSLFIKSTHHRAIHPIKRVKCIIDHGETFFFRTDRWQFRVIRHHMDPKQFIIATVIFLDDGEYRYYCER